MEQELGISDPLVCARHQVALEWLPDDGKFDVLACPACNEAEQTRAAARRILASVPPLDTRAVCKEDR